MADFGPDKGADEDGVEGLVGVEAIDPRRAETAASSRSVTEDSLGVFDGAGLGVYHASLVRYVP